jgi:hypothetical protein
VENYVNRHIGIRQADRAQDVLGIVDIDVTDDGKAEQAHRLLAMDHSYYTGVSFSLEAQDSALASRFEHVLLHNRLECGYYEKKPE